MKLSLEILKKIVPDASVIQGDLGQNLFFSIDSRTIQKDQVFVPFKGEHVDGHSFIEDALKKGAGSFVSYLCKEFDTQMSRRYPNALVIMVNDPASAFLKLASWWRAQFSIPVIGITGSIGKTSTKFFLEDMLARAGKKVLVTPGNQNTCIGIALSFAYLSPEYEYFICEMGISKKGEMDELVKLVRPTIALITAIGHSHLEELGSLEGVACEKKKILSLLKPEDVAILNGDSEYLNKGVYSHRVILCGRKRYNDLKISGVKMKDGKMTFALTMCDRKLHVESNTSHEGLLTTGLMAACAASFLGVADGYIVEALRSPVERKRRFQQRALPYNNSFLIDDAYNSSPESLKAALFAFDTIAWEGTKIAVIGDMLALGDKSAYYHRHVGKLFNKLHSIDRLILVGNQVDYMKRVLPATLKVDHCVTLSEAEKLLDTLMGDDTFVLFKASFGMKFIELVNRFSHPITPLE